MGNPEGFLKVHRIEPGYRPVEERIQDYSEVEKKLPENLRRLQASRCMDCGVPFCHWACPLGNIMPEWQDRIYRGDWEGAWKILQETNNFPEFTGRVCPAPCEASCVLAIDDDPVTIRQNELDVIEKAFAEGWARPRPPHKRTGRKAAVIGGGPAGLACADMLNRMGHSVVLFEAEDRVGGYLRYGIPDFKLNKHFIDRRIDLLKKEGLEIRTGVYVGRDISMEEIRKQYDAVCICIGAREPRDLAVPGRDLGGIHFAMEYLNQQNRADREINISSNELLFALNRDIVVIGGGDTGADCVGTANRQGARSITQIELLPEPPERRTPDQPWPLWPRLRKTSSSHEEGCSRIWNVSTRSFSGEGGRVRAVHAVKVAWDAREGGAPLMREIPGSEFEIKADLVLLAMGFLHPVHEGLVGDLGLELDARGNIKTGGGGMTSVEGIFSAGDSSRGASLVVWAIHEGREAALSMDIYLNSKK